VLIMTTEIFRNLILEGSSRIDNIYYVVFDEIHFLDDEERGTVWEECIILAPLNIQFLCLSATVPNIDELSAWMSTVRDTDFVVIKETKRPVPLRHHLYSTKYGMINQTVVKKKYKKKFAQRKKFFRQKPSSKRIIEQVIHDGRIPVLYFCFNRRACERNAQIHYKLRLLNSEERETLKKLVDELIKLYHLEDYERLESMRTLWEAGCAYHHAGILPAAKEIVERLFTTGLIKILFCTETFSLGINMPASSVIFDELEKFNGVDFVYLSTRQYHQMAGRAGRRGLDKEGHVYSLIIPEATDPRELERIFYHQSERIQSRFFASYSTILNLYSRLGDDAYELFRKSLQNYKRGEFLFTKSYQKEENQIRNRIRFLQATGFLEGTVLTDKGQLAAAVNGYEIQAAELYYSRSFDECNPQQLCVLLASIVSEERKNKANDSILKFSFHGEKVIRTLRKKEIQHNIIKPVRELDFSLSAPVYAWANGCSLAQLESYGIPEGDIVRLLRMVIQLLRTLRDTLEDPVIGERMHEALTLINRDVVDAQAELEVG